jgi:predicted HTH transcriptional regulator
MGLLNEDGQVTNAGLLLSDQGALKQSRIVCTRWKGKTKGEVDGDALDDKEYKDSCLITLLNNAEAFIRNNSRTPWTIRGMRREENSDYPFKAVREVLVNALIHRDYQIIGTEVHVDIFDDRLEIISPGGMMNGSRIQDLDLRHVPSIRRNEVVSDIFSRLNFMERRGSGIGRILNSYCGLDEQPIFQSNEYFFTVTLPNRGVATPSQIEMKFEETNDLTETERGNGGFGSTGV